MSKQELHPRTEIINKKQKNQAKIARNEALDWLATFFPAVFDNSVSIQPLKLGIMDDILEHANEAFAAGISKSKLREAVVIFTRRVDYLTCLKAREMRVDLAGNPVAQVSEEEANLAAMKIKRRVEKSSKNARKVLATKASSHNHFVFNDQIKYQAEHQNSLLGSDDASSYRAQSSLPRAAPVVIKHKSTRAYDPDAVARLKEKLGLSLKRDVSKEIS